MLAGAKPARSADPAAVARLIADLDSNRFRVREAATRELRDLGEAVGSALRKALAATPSAEAEPRLEELLAVLGVEWPAAGATLRDLRAVVVLERLGTPDAVKVLAALAGGAAGARHGGGEGGARPARGAVRSAMSSPEEPPCSRSLSSP